MANPSARVTVTTTATPVLSGLAPRFREVAIKNLGPNVVHLGDATLTTATSFPLDVSETLIVELTQYEGPYAMVAANQSAVLALFQTTGV